MTEKPQFVIEEDKPNIFGRKMHVKKDGRLDYLGKIINYDEGWRWVETMPNELLPFVKNVTLPTSEIAASFLYAIKERADAFCKAHPIPQDLSGYLERKARDLWEAHQKLLHQFWEVRHDLHMLNKFANQYGMETIKWQTEDVDQERIVRKLLEFSVFIEAENREVPFFSEVALYNLVGKDDARTILSLIKKLCNAIAPNIVSEY